MGENSLLSTALWEPIWRKHLDDILRDAREREEAIREFLEREGCGIEDVIYEVRYFGKPRFKVRRLTADEKWLNWLSNNHGWGDADNG